MKANERFLNKPGSFWAHVRSISEAVGYTRDRRIKVPSLAEIVRGMEKNGLNHRHLVANLPSQPSPLGAELSAYFAHRARSLNEYVEPRLMDREEAAALFEEHHRRLSPACPIPMNKQKGGKRTPAYLTGLVNMLIESSIGDRPCDYDPKRLTSVTKSKQPLRTLSRRLDGAFPSVRNPVAVWEVKEYYNTTTFGSRVADGVYETLLDGMELAELLEHEGVKVHHYLFVDSRFTWWECGKSYLCRIVDMLHMGYVDEVLFGREVAERLPDLARCWCALGPR